MGGSGICRYEVLLVCTVKNYLISQCIEPDSHQMNFYLTG